MFWPDCGKACADKLAKKQRGTSWCPVSDLGGHESNADRSADSPADARSSCALIGPALDKVLPRL
jgi:hypothetical protein